jgi:uncharacterized MnhB-related membrane protein
MIDVLLIFAIITALLSLQTRDLLTAVIIFSVFSLLCALLYYFLHAPDVALTEAAVGAGLSTFIFIWVIRRTGRKDTGR